MKFFPDNVNPSVKAEQIRMLYQQGNTVQLLGILSAFISVSVLWDVAEHAKLYLWLLVITVVTLLRLAVTIRFNRVNPTEATIGRWGTIYTLGTFISGVVWGGLSLFYDSAWPAPYQVMLFVIYTGVIAGAFNTNASYFVSYPAFYLPPVFCLMYVILQQERQGFFELAALFAIYIVLMYVSALKFNNRLSNALQLRFENEQLAHDLAVSNEKLIQLADMDALTQIYNRRSMDRFLAAQWNKHHEQQKPLSLLFIDIDYFKQYNDTYGHNEGDRCLIRIAEILRGNVHCSSDMAARFGGEEFAVILPETTLEQAVRIAEKIFDELEHLYLPHSGSSVSDRITLSIGISTMIPDYPDKADLIRLAADKALYKAKENGRNQIVCASDADITL